MIPFSPPRIDRPIIEEVTKVLESGWITTGPKTKQFEIELSKYVGVQNVLCVNSATNGLELILRWFGVSEGDEVIVPAYTYCATANVVLHCGAKVVMVDVNDDFNVNVEALKNAITDKTKVIIPVDIAGFPCDYDEINAIIRNSEIEGLFQPQTDPQSKLGRILLLSDAAHSFGAVYKDRKSGTLADISVFSFHAVKNLTTAEGGAICFNLPKPFDNAKMYSRLCIQTLHGQSKDALAKSKTGNWEYDVAEPGYKCNMTDILAAIGLVELARYNSETLKRRREIFERYHTGFIKHDWAMVPEYENQNKTSSFHAFLLRIHNISKEQRNLIIESIYAEQVSVNVHFKPLPLLSLYKNLGFKMDDYPVAYRNFSQEISLPVFFDLSDEQADKVVSAVNAAVKKVL